MYSLDKQRQKVTVFERSSVLWLNFRWEGKRYRLTTGLPNNKEGNKAALGIASQIESDLIFQRLTEERLYSYLGKESPNTVKVKSLSELWDEFVEYQKTQMEETTFKDSFKTARNIMTFLLSSEIDMECKSSVAKKSLEKYAVSTIQRFCNDLISFGNWLKRSGYRETNPYESIKKMLPALPKSKRAKKAYSEDEALAIVEAFRNNTFTHADSRYDDRHYADFVEFLLLIGCRPSDAAALTVGDIFQRQGAMYIRIDKAYSKGVLKGTKTGTIRVIKCNEAMERILTPHLERPRECLIFTAQLGGNIDTHNFTPRYTRRVVEALVKRGKVREYLGTYNCRHTAITRMVRSGIDPSTVGAICGNSPETIFEHYLQANENADLPGIEGDSAKW
ncbi:tyrosine-type recombinase/integrase [Oscillatoria sp. FACHB-1406]|uniref:tyrosine-type recombinase/integrase n=1 Tax=Oscillatoria sp. FACHB-1406 TaxID=2692846 RepID=UPI00168545C6|nr:tyrosine-type recombinase/integrase [Oscillatoria sp. FACHB-1406]MBD2578640.1 tyrosine-type recombinase/integrase [Oscillatoria sp. FACHB-1406]